MQQCTLSGAMPDARACLIILRKYGNKSYLFWGYFRSALHLKLCFCGNTTIIMRVYRRIFLDVKNWPFSLFVYLIMFPYWDRNPFTTSVYCHCLFFTEFEKCNGSATVKILINRLCETARFAFTFKMYLKRMKRAKKLRNNCVREKISH